MKLAVVTCFHGRPGISEVFLLGLRRLQQKFNVRCFAAITDGDTDNVLLCEKYGVQYAMHDNIDLGAKHNVAARLAGEWAPDMVIVLGSDDLVSDHYVAWLDAARHLGYDYFYPHAVTLYSPVTGSGMMLSGPFRFLRVVFGAGRAWSRSLMEKVDWAPWEEVGLRKGLDNSSHRKLMRHEPEVAVLNDALSHVLDVKSPDNIWQPEMFTGRGRKVDGGTAMWFAGAPEKEAILRLSEQRVPAA